MCICSISRTYLLISFFFNDTAPTEIYTLSLHDALPILEAEWKAALERNHGVFFDRLLALCNMPMSRYLEWLEEKGQTRSEEHTSELQSRPHLVCRLLLEKKKKQVK